MGHWIRAAIAVLAHVLKCPELPWRPDSGQKLFFGILSFWVEHYCLLPIAYCLLPIAYCLLPIAYCLLPTAYCLLPVAYCPLPIAYCLLPISSCLSCYEEGRSLFAKFGPRSSDLPTGAVSPGGPVKRVLPS